MKIVVEDLSSGAVQDLLALHLRGMHDSSPPGSVFALDLSGLKAADVTVWSVWRENRLAAVGALKRLDESTGEIKSMRTHPDHLRTGAAAALLDYIILQARTAGMTCISLETGSGPAFEPALALYRRRGFVDCPAFAEYENSAFNQFLHLPL